MSGFKRQCRVPHVNKKGRKQIKIHRDCLNDKKYQSLQFVAKKL